MNFNRYLLLLCFLLPGTGQSQALRDINYKYLYNPNEAIHFLMSAIQQPEGHTLFFKLELQDTVTYKPGDFSVQWEIRNNLNEKEGKVIETDSILKDTQTHGFYGTVMIGRSSSTQIVVAKVINNSLKRAWMFYKILEPNYPVDAYLFSGSEPVVTSYIKQFSTVTVQGSDSEKIVSFYNDDFPKGSPPFSESLGRVSKGMRVDSTFHITAQQPFTLETKGLYLVQDDTNAVKGFAFRVEDDYPRLARLESLADPLIYICTKQESDRIKLAKGDKRAFDKVILTITGNADRAKTLIKNYFRRVELANQYFTSYKEGWKTDRGMIYIIFGLPDEVFKFTDREVWKYKNDMYKIDFEFVKSSTVFDPDNYALIRQNKYKITWYEVIDLWRSARF